MKPLISSKIAGIIYALAVGTFGVLHFLNADAMKASVPDYMPGDGSIWIYFTGACMILAAIAIIINKFTRLACYLLAAMFLIFVVTLHLKPLLSGGFTHLLKDISMAMGAILIGNNSGK
jgi:putative oxidoreductase